MILGLFGFCDSLWSLFMVLFDRYRSIGLEEIFMFPTSCLL